MTEPDFIERRRLPRFDTQIAAVALLPSAMNVRVREIGVHGVLLQGSEAVPVGTAGSLRITLGGVPFTADVQVRRVGPSRAGSGLGYEIAAAFVAIRPEHRQLIERFVKQ
jgi:PilZ domain-containing protein